MVDLKELTRKDNSLRIKNKKNLYQSLATQMQVIRY